ncbi:hypothetical protein [Romboutsia sp. 1001713B170131_170501_G6]|uniref:hypothetical protein n=1 Tax=Romboutsia sp. 1001713B170131_170501_G6 TaxID=2787108 RepID=UPI0018AA4CFD|nr:hypothetical protein [Romboutsia sp. 1001713B170131_170501_G6]
MGKEKFNELEVKEQIEYINQNLENKTLTKICEDIKVSRSTIRKRFLKQGYIFDKDQSKYINLEANKKLREGNKCKSNTNELECKVKALETKIKGIEDRLNSSSSKQINIKKFEGKTVSRCYRLYEDVQKEFSKFCKENSNYKVQDILSMALYEYMKNNI